MTISEQNMREAKEIAGNMRGLLDYDNNDLPVIAQALQSKTDEINAIKSQVNALRDALSDVAKQPDCLSFNCVTKVTKALSSTPEQCLADVVKQARDKALDEFIAEPVANDTVEAFAEAYGVKPSVKLKWSLGVAIKDQIQSLKGK